MARTVDEARREIDQTRERLTATLDRLGEHIELKKDELRERADVLKPVRQRVRMDPLPMLGLAFGVGVLAGVLRRGRGRAEAEEEPDTVYEEVRERRDPEAWDHSHASHHSLLRELRSALIRQASNALIAAIAGVVSARMSDGEHETHEPSAD